MSRSKFRQGQVDEAKQLGANYVLGREDRQAIDDQIRALQEIQVESVANGLQVLWFVVSGQALSVGDVVCPAVEAATPQARYMTLATPAALAATGGKPGGVVLRAAPINGRVPVATAGILEKAVTGLGDIAGPVRVTNGRCERVAEYVDGDIPIGYVGAQGNLTLGLGGSGGAGGGDGLPGAPGASYGGTSTSTVSFATGVRTFPTQTGLAYLPGMRVRAARQGDTTKWLEGRVIAYAAGSLQINADKVAPGASGTANDWNLGLAGEPGTDGAVPPPPVRLVIPDNIANLAAFPVAQQGVTLIAGNVVLPIAQANPLQNVAHVVGAVSGGLAPLTPRGDPAYTDGTFIKVTDGELGDLWGYQSNSWATVRSGRKSYGQYGSWILNAPRDAPGVNLGIPWEVQRGASGVAPASVPFDFLPSGEGPISGTYGLTLEVIARWADGKREYISTRGVCGIGLPPTELATNLSAARCQPASYLTVTITVVGNAMRLTVQNGRPSAVVYTVLASARVVPDPG